MMAKRNVKNITVCLQPDIINKLRYIESVVSNRGWSRSQVVAQCINVTYHLMPPVVTKVWGIAMKLKNESFYDPGARDTGITSSEYRREYTRLYTNYEKRMTALKNNGFAWTETYKEFKGMPKPSQLKSERGIRNNLKGLYDFFNDPMTSTRAQQRARNTIIKQFNDAGIPLKKNEYERYMKFLNWLSTQFKNIGFSSGYIYEAYKQAENNTQDKRASNIYMTFAREQGLKVDGVGTSKRRKTNKNN